MSGPHTIDEWIAICDDQNAELDRLRAENERLREALERIRDMSFGFEARNIARAALRAAGVDVEGKE